MNKVFEWLTENIDDLYHLKYERIYLSQIGVRYHRHILKARAMNYLMDNAENVMLNKNRRKRLKQVDDLQNNVSSK